MDTSYDEDISQNPFFVELQSDHVELFNRCIAEGWILCVPRVTTVLSQIFTLQDFLGHILVCNEELPATHFITLTDKIVRVVNRIIFTQENKNGTPSEIPILFEETFYTSDKVKYKVWCIEFPLELEHPPRPHATISHCRTLVSLRDCIDFLWTECSGKEILENIETEAQHCKAAITQSYNTTLHHCKDIVHTLYNTCVQIALKNRQLKEKCNSCQNTLANVRLAVETYMHHVVYNELFHTLSTFTAQEDASLNKIIRNLSNIQLQDLRIGQEFRECIPEARRSLSLIQSYSTVLGKGGCLRGTLTTISKAPTKIYATTDEFLPVLIFLVLKSGIPNWYTHLNILKHFRFSSNTFSESDETSFCICTLEAVIEQIKSGIFQSNPYPESQAAVSDTDESFEMIGISNSDSSSAKKESEISTNLQYLFEQVKLSNLEQVKEILLQSKTASSDNANSNDSFDSVTPLSLKDLSLDDFFNEDSSEESTSMCHPLCACNKCNRVLTNHLLKSSPSVHSKDNHGFNALHVAVLYNQIQIIDLILEMGGDPNSVDNSGSTPLHYAASKGYQTAMFLLLNEGANFNKENMDKNTPLHYACNNGHDSCVKALIYFCEQSKNILKLQAVNESGDTPLHLASKWGYQSIVRILLENGAEAWVKNGKGKTPMDLAHSPLIRDLLLSVTPNVMEYVNVSFDSDKKKSQLLSSVVLLDLNDDTKPSMEECKSVAFKSIMKPVKPKCTGDIHQIERLFRAITFGDVKLACFYMNIEFDSNVNEKDVTKKSELNECHPLCVCDKCNRFKTTLGNKSFNINMCNSKGDTSLHVAVKHNRLEICDILLKNGAITNVKNNIGQIPLHIAAKENKIAIMEMLLKYSGNIDIKDATGNTPMHLACKMGSIEAVKLLLKSHPYIDSKNFANKTPLDEAKDHLNLTIIDLIEEAIMKSNN